MKKMKSILGMLTFCAVLSFASNLKDESKNGEMVVGVTYMMAEHGASNEEAAIVGAVGTVVNAGLAGSLGGPAGFAFGVIYGL